MYIQLDKLKYWIEFFENGEVEKVVRCEIENI